MSLKQTYDAYARAQVVLQDPNNTLSPQERHTLQVFVDNVEQLASENFTPGELQEIQQSEIQPRRVRISQERVARNREAAQAATLRQRENRVRKDTAGMFGEKDGLSPEAFEDLTNKTKNGRITGTLKLPTNKAFVNQERLEAQAKKAGPLFGLKNPTAKQFHNRLDDILEAKRHDHAKYDRYVESLKIPRDEIDQYMDAWATESMALGLAKRYAEQDKDLPDYEEVEVSNRNAIRAELIDRFQQAEDETGETFEGNSDISSGFRKDAVVETAKIHHEVASRGEDTEGYMGTRDALVRAFDQHESQEA